MQRFLALLVVMLIDFSIGMQAQEDHIPYRVQIVPKSIQGFPGLHSFAFGVHDGKWLLIGGRLDGI